MLCALYASALSYASPYKGAGRSGYIHTTMHRSQSYSHSGITTMAQAPMATMGSTSAITRGIANSSDAVSANTYDVRGIQTSASAIQGGQTASQTYNQIAYSGPRRASSSTPPSSEDDGYCPHCHYIWDASLNHGRGGWVCESCGCELKDGCDCEEESGYCWCPIEFDLEVWLFFASLAGAYAVYKKRTSTVQ